jgi:RNA polymerase sigma-70 factor (ECF subfamily)
MEKRTDKELMKLIANKNTDALKALYRRYEIQIFNFILRYTGSREIAQELIQETFTRIWFAAHTFDQKRGNFKGWIYTIALNITRNEMSKKEYSYHFLDVDEIPEYRPENEDLKTESPDMVLEQKELSHSIANALGKLKPYLREVIIMKNYQHMKFREIAEATNIPEGTLKARYHRAVALLKEYLAPKECGGNNPCVI